MKKTWLIALAVAGASTLGGWVMSDDKPQLPAGMSDADKMMMEQMMKLAAPGEQHQKFAKYVGKWKAVTTWKMGPDAPEESAEGTTEYSLALGGRWLVQKHSGKFMGAPYEGMGMVGFDNAKKQPVSIWMDTMSTKAMMNYGTESEGGKVTTYAGELEMPGPDGKPASMPFRYVVTEISDDEHTFEWYDKTPDGKEVKSMWIRYTRIK